MDSVGVRELRQNLSVYLRRVATGEVLRVTDRGHAVAMLTPLPPDDHPLADLVAVGAATPSRRRLAELPPPAATDAATRLSDIVQQMRAEDER